MVIFFVGMITLQAQESLKVKFRSRALLDATLSGYGKESTQGYYPPGSLPTGNIPACFLFHSPTVWHPARHANGT